MKTYKFYLIFSQIFLKIKKFSIAPHCPLTVKSLVTALQLVIHQIVRTTPIKNANKPRNYTIRACKKQKNWTMDYCASFIPDRSKPQCLICYEIMCENKKFSVNRHYLSKHSTSIEKIFIM